MNLEMGGRDCDNKITRRRQLMACGGRGRNLRFGTSAGF